MNRQQKQRMDSFVRVRSFLDANPVTGTLSYTSAREMLEDVVQRTREYAGAQVSGRELSRAEARRQADQIASLFDRHMRPIVTIAKSQIAPESDVGLPAALRPRALAWLAKRGVTLRFSGGPASYLRQRIAVPKNASAPEA